MNNYEYNNDMKMKYFVYYLVTVFVPVVKGAQNYGVDVPSDKVGAYGTFSACFKFFGIFIVHGISPRKLNKLYQNVRKMSIVWLY